MILLFIITVAIFVVLALFHLNGGKFSSVGSCEVDILSFVESDGSFYRLRGSDIKINVTLFHSLNEVLSAEGGFIRKDGSSKYVSQRVHKSDISLYKVTYTADLRNLYIEKSLRVFSNSVDSLIAEIERIFKEWATLTELQEKEDALLNEKKVSLAQSYLKHNLPKLRNLFIEAKSEDYRSLYYRVKKRIDFLSKIEGSLDKDDDLSFRALDKPEETVSALNLDHSKRDCITSEVKGLYYRDKEAQFAARLLKVGDEVTLVPEPDNEYDCFAVKVITSDGYFIGYIEKSVSVNVYVRLKDISSCRVVRRTNHSLPYITIRIEFMA